jgi:hypothetical protein
MPQQLEAWLTDIQYGFWFDRKSQNIGDNRKGWLRRKGACRVFFTELLFIVKVTQKKCRKLRFYIKNQNFLMQMQIIPNYSVIPVLFHKGKLFQNILFGRQLFYLTTLVWVV